MRNSVHVSLNVVLISFVRTQAPCSYICQLGPGWGWLIALKEHTHVNYEMADAPVPVRVSPLIKFGRWSFLLVGVMYGASHRRSLAKKEEKLREIEEKKRVVQEEKLAEEKVRLAKQELEDLAKAAGVPPEA